MDGWVARDRAQLHHRQYGLRCCFTQSSNLPALVKLVILTSVERAQRKQSAQSGPAPHMIGRAAILRLLLPERALIQKLGPGHALQLRCQCQTKVTELCDAETIDLKRHATCIARSVGTLSDVLGPGGTRLGMEKDGGGTKPWARSVLSANGQ